LSNSSCFFAISVSSVAMLWFLAWMGVQTSAYPAAALPNSRMSAIGMMASFG
jgi:hypothetical protein